MTPKSVSTAATLIIIFSVIAIVYVMQSIIVPLLFAIIFSIMMFPLCSLLERWNLPRAAASVISLLVLIIIVSGAVSLLVNQVIIIGKDGDDIAKNFLTVYDSITKWIESTFGIERGEFTNRIREQGQSTLSNAGSYALAAFSSAGGTLANAVLIPIYIFFMLYYRDFFQDFFIRLNSDEPAENTRKILKEIYAVIQSYLLGMLTVMGIVAILNTAGLLVMGIDYAWFFGIFAAVMILIPYIGIAIGSIIPALFALATMDSYWYALGIVIWFQIVQFLEGNFITPNIVGGKVNLNPLFAIISLLLGGMLFGLAGLILAIPIMAVLKILLGLNKNTEPYSFLIGEPTKDHLKKETFLNWFSKHQSNSGKIE
ncbi:MAG TPA: AI-2E family transporter [Lunatimonas sp.]|nr:AI-2E family transporter [Lunatimonas sp.]